MALQLQPRVKFEASTNSSGDIVEGSAISGFNTPGSGAYSYLLESGTDWEIGFNDPSKSSGSRRVPWSNSGSNFANSTSGLTCSLVALPGALMSQTPADDGALGSSPIISGVNGIAFGRGATALAAECMAIGIGASTEGAGAIAIGRSAGAEFLGSMAIGRQARSTSPGERVFGNSFTPHVTHLPVTSDSDGSVGSVRLLALHHGNFDGSNLAAAMYSMKPTGPGDNFYAEIRIQGTISMIAGTTENTRKVIDVDAMVTYNLSDSAVNILWETYTAKHSGASAVDVTVSLDYQCLPQITVNSTASGLKVNGLLTLTKIMHT